MTFSVIDKTTGEVADLAEIEKEQWVKDAGLFRVYRAEWLLNEYGELYLCDPCGHITTADTDRFEVRFPEIMKCVDDEPELPGDPPKEMIDVLTSVIRDGDLDTLIEMLRFTVRETKKGIKNRIARECGLEV